MIYKCYWYDRYWPEICYQRLILVNSLGLWTCWSMEILEIRNSKVLHSLKDIHLWWKLWLQFIMYMVSWIQLYLLCHLILNSCLEVYLLQNLIIHCCWYCPSDTIKLGHHWTLNISMKFLFKFQLNFCSKFKYFHSTKWVWNLRLQNGGHLWLQCVEFHWPSRNQSLWS